MEFLTTQIGEFPLGIWLSVIIGLVAGWNLINQGISIFNWRLALKLRVQEHAPDDPNLVNRTHMVMEWGYAIADFVSHIVIVPLSILLTIQGNYWGFVLSTFLYIFFFYVGIMLTAQRYGLVKFGLKNSFKEYTRVVRFYWIAVVIPSIIGAISLWSNTEYFAWP
jgi:hypothetical protein